MEPKKILMELVKANLGPVLFLMIAGGLCMVLPMDKRVEGIYLVVGAALTRIKRTDG